MIIHLLNTTQLDFPAHAEAHITSDMIQIYTGDPEKPDFKTLARVPRAHVLWMDYEHHRVPGTVVNFPTPAPTQ